jgi:hypothetical protein
MGNRIMIWRVCNKFFENEQFEPDTKVTQYLISISKIRETFVSQDPARLNVKITEIHLCEQFTRFSFLIYFEITNAYIVFHKNRIRGLVDIFLYIKADHLNFYL